MKKVLGYFKPYKWQSIAGPLFKLLEATFELLVPIVVAFIVDKGLGELVDGGYPNADKSTIALCSGVLALFGLLGLVFSVTAQYFAARAATGVCAGLRRDLFRKLTSLSYKDLDKLGTSAMLTRMTSDIDRLQSAINLALRLFLRSPFIVFGAVITAWIVDPASLGTFALTVGVLHSRPSVIKLATKGYGLARKHGSHSAFKGFFGIRKSRAKAGITKPKLHKSGNRVVGDLLFPKSVFGILTLVEPFHKGINILASRNGKISCCGIDVMPERIRLSALKILCIKPRSEGIKGRILLGKRSRLFFICFRSLRGS